MIKEFIKKNQYIVILFFIGEIAAIIAGILLKSSALVFCSSVMGILYVASVSSKLWFSPILGLLSSGLYVAQCFFVQNYGEVFINLTVCIPLIIWGVVNFIKNKKHNNIEVIQNRISKKELIILLSVGIFIIIGVFFLLKYLHTPYIYVALVSVFFTIVGNYLLARRDGRMFFVFILGNIISIILWLMPVFNGNPRGTELIPLAVTYLIYFLLNLHGFYIWNKDSKVELTNVKQNDKEENEG